MHCHFLETDAHLNKQPQQVIFSWWQTIFWLNCTGNNLRNLKEYPRWFVVLALRYAKGNTAEQTFLRLCSTFDLCLMGFRDPLALLIGLSSCLMGSLMPQTPSIEFSTHPLKLFSLVPERFLESIPTMLSLTSEHRRASANMDNSQTLQIQLHLSKERRKNTLWTSHFKIPILTAFALY